MYKLEYDKEIEDIVNITKSDSGVSGPRLTEAHEILGKELAKHMDFLPEETTVVAILRGGLFFATGIYRELGCKFQLYDPKKDIYQRPNTKNVILVDSVVNTGKTIEDLLDANTYVACCVINENAVEKFSSCLYTVRVSSNYYVGSDIKKQEGKKGPDTTMRLFHLI